jgi:hypothetical protein
VFPPAGDHGALAFATVGELIIIAAMDTLALLGKRVRYRGKEGLVVGRLDPQSRAGIAWPPCAAPRSRSASRGPLGATLVEVEGAELGAIELLD